MARPAKQNPTDLELEILKRLWQLGPLTGHAVRDALTPERELTYQSVMTMLGIMADKGYVKRRKEGGNWVYRARVTEKVTSKRMLHDLVARLFDGSAAAAMLNLLETSKLSDEELSQLRESVDRHHEE